MLHEFRMETDSLSIIPLTENDIEQMRIWRNLDHIRKNFIFSGIIDSEGQKKWFEKHKYTSNDYVFMINEKKSLNKKIGTVSIYNFSEDNKTAEFGRFFIGADDAHGKGYGVISARLACNVAFKEMDIQKLILEVFQDNIVAYNIYKKVGFRQVGTKMCDSRMLIKMELKKDEFKVETL